MATIVLNTLSTMLKTSKCFWQLPTSLESVIDAPLCVSDNEYFKTSQITFSNNKGINMAIQEATTESCKPCM